MSEAKKRIVLFLGAGAVESMGYKTTSKFYEMINDSPAFKKNVLWNIMIRSNLMTDIEQILYVLENIISINKKKDDDSDIMRSADWIFYNMTVRRDTSINVPDKLDIDFYNKFLRLFYNINELSKYFDTLGDFMGEVKNLKSAIQNNIINEYKDVRGIENTKTIKTFIDLLAKYSTDLSIFTTNYESTIRKVIEENNAINDSFDDNHQFNPKKSRFHNEKSIMYGQLHGSLLWTQLRKDIIRNDLSQMDFGENGRLVIYPTLRTKREQYKLEPYKHYFDQFKEKMDEADMCIIIGFSFRDELSGDLLRFQNNLFIIDKEDGENAYEKYIDRLENNNVRDNYFKDNPNDISQDNVFLQGFPQTDDSLKELLDKIDRYYKIKLRET